MSPDHRPLSAVADALDVERSTDAVGAELDAAVRGGRSDVVWLVLAAVRAELPTEHQLVAATRDVRLDGGRQFLASELAAAAARPDQDACQVEVLRDAVVLDAGPALAADPRDGDDLARLVRTAVGTWTSPRATPPPVVVSWCQDRSLRRHRSGATRHLLVPWRCTWVVADSAPTHARAARVRAVARSGAGRLSVLWGGLAPVLEAEPQHRRDGAAEHLSTLKWAQTVVAPTASGARELVALAAAFAAEGIANVDVVTVPLPSAPPPPVGADVTAARRALGSGPLPVLVHVGPLGPRVGTLDLLHEADVLWRRGHRFALALLSTAETDREVTARVVELQDRGRAAHLLEAPADDVLAAAALAAHAVVQPRDHDALALAVRRCLGSGVPVVCPPTGAAGEAAAGAGGLLVEDSGRSLRDALTALLTDDDLHRGLRADASAATAAGEDLTAWAAAAWTALTAPDGARPGSPPAARRPDLLP